MTIIVSDSYLNKPTVALVHIVKAIITEYVIAYVAVHLKSKADPILPCAWYNLRVIESSW